MTIKKRLSKSNMYMFLIPMLAAAALLILGAGIALYILETNYLPKLGLDLRELHLMLEQYEDPMQSFEVFVWIYVGAVGMALILTILFTNVYLSHELFSHISAPLDILVEGVERIRSGDLEHPICYTEPDEFKAACDAVDMMAARLRASLEAEQRRQQSSKELIAGMSHDLKSPLTSIRAYTEALLEGVADTPEAQMRYLSTIHDKEGEMEHMVACLLEFSRLELSEYPAKAESLDLRAELEHMVSGMAQEAEIDLSGVSGSRVCADREQLRRIVENIIGNSTKYCPERPRIEISSQRLESFVRIKFSDNGPGVPAEALPRLFDLFYRADPARAKPGSGSGLGLAIVKRSVEQMGGRTFAERGESGGLCIVIDLPGGTNNG